MIDAGTGISSSAISHLRPNARTPGIRIQNLIKTFSSHFIELCYASLRYQLKKFSVISEMQTIELNMQRIARGFQLLVCTI